MINLKELREDAGMSVETLSERTGLSRTQIWHYEAGRREPPLNALCAISDALDVSLDKLVRGEEKDRLTGRPIGELLEMFGKIPADQLNLIRALIDTSLADRRVQESHRPDSQAKP